MTLQSKRKTTGLRRFILPAMFLIVASVSASAQQTNTFPPSGNAGVGTITPTLQSGTSNTMVEVKGTVNPGVGLTSTAAGGRQYFVYSSQANPGYFSVFDATAGADRFVIGNSGNVGIGTATPGGTLSVVGTSAAVEAHILNNSATGYQALRFGVDSASPTGAVLGHFNGSFATSGAYLANGSYLAGYGTGGLTLGAEHASGAVNFFTGGSAAGNQRMIITSSGNVGIGITNPTDRLSVYKGDNNAYLRIGAPLLYQSAIGFSDDTNGQDSVIYRPGSTRDLAFYTTTAGNVMYVTQGGSVGIATSSPNSQYKLDVNGEINATGFRINGTPISSGGSSQWSGTSGNPIYYNGNVGIGTDNPQSNLQVGSQTPGATASPATLSLGGSYSSSAGANFKLKLYDDGVVGNTYGIGVSSGTMEFGVHTSAGYKWYAGGVNKMTLNSNGDLSVSGAIAAKYQDVAEWVPSSEQLAAGTVVVLDTTKSNQVVSATVAYDTRVAGVISAQPGITLGESGEGKVLVATTGRVRVKVDASRGAIQIGDLLVTSDVLGVAMKSEAVNLGAVQIHRPGTIIGKALEPLAKGSGQILVLLSLQ